MEPLVFPGIISCHVLTETVLHPLFRCGCLLFLPLACLLGRGLGALCGGEWGGVGTLSRSWSSGSAPRLPAASVMVAVASIAFKCILSTPTSWRVFIMSGCRTESLPSAILGTGGLCFLIKGSLFEAVKSLDSIFLTPCPWEASDVCTQSQGCVWGVVGPGVGWT